MKRIACVILVVLMLVSSLTFAEGNNSYVDLQKGSKGNAVAQLQTRLKELGFYSIAIDGDYGNGTANALKAFEEYNGLEPTGVATKELQALIFSDEAQGIEIPDVEVSSVGMKKSYGYYFLRPTLINHTENTISSITYRLKVYNAAGERVGSLGVLKQSEIYSYGDGMDYGLESATGEVNGLNIQAGKKYTISSSKEIDLYSFDQSMIDSVYIGIIRYVTSEGEVIEIPENEQLWYGSNGRIVTVEYENNLKPQKELSFEIEQRADAFSLGFQSCYIPNFFADVVGLPMGGIYLNYVDEGSPAKEAGLKEGDIVIKIGDVWTYDNDSVILAKGLMDEQTPARVIFYRRGQRAETEISAF